SSQMTPSWRESRNGIPPYVDALVTSATTRDKASRPADATVMLDHARRPRRAPASGVMDDPALSFAMRATTLDAANQPTQQVPALASAVAARGQGGSPDAVQRTATLRFTPSTPISPGHPPVADGMAYYDAPADPPSRSARQLRQ